MKKVTKENTKGYRKETENDEEELENPIWNYIFILFFIGCAIAYLTFVHLEVDPKWDEYIQSHSMTIEEMKERDRQYDEMEEELHKPESDVMDPAKNPYLSDGTEKEVY